MSVALHERVVLWVRPCSLHDESTLDLPAFMAHVVAKGREAGATFHGRLASCALLSFEEVSLEAALDVAATLTAHARDMGGAMAAGLAHGRAAAGVDPR